MFLDEQTEQVEQTLKRVDMLRAAVVRRDKGALEELSQQVQMQAAQKRQSEIKQQQLQRKIAAFCRCPIEDANISRLCKQLHEPQDQEIQRKQSRLQSLIFKLSNECKAAELMLRECVRFNRVLLRSLLGDKNQTRTYTAQGREQWSMHWGLMNAKL